MENEPTTKTPIPARSGFRNFALCTLIFAFSISLPSTLVETPLQISLFYAKQTQCQNRQNQHKYSNTKGLCQSTTNNEQRTLFKTNPLKPNFKRSKPISNAQTAYPACRTRDCHGTLGLAMTGGKRTPAARGGGWGDGGVFGKNPG